MAKLTLEELVEGVLAGDRRCLGRAITAVEDGSETSWELLKRISPNVGSALRVGITGPPGAGKSTLADALVREFRNLSLIHISEPTRPY